VAVPIEMPANSLTLEQALTQGIETTLPYLKARLSVKSFADQNLRNTRYELPSSIRFVGGPSESNKNKISLRPFLNRFRSWSYQKKITKAQDLAVQFQCSNVLESQAMGLSLERNFPEADAIALSETLHEKVVSCDDPSKEESLLRLAIFSIQKGKCEKALEYLKNFPATTERGINDRLSYLQGLCSAPSNLVENRNPWGGYGIRLGDLKIPQQEKPLWFLSASSGSEDWDRLLMSLIELVEKGEFEKLRHLASQLDYEKFRTLAYPFQASVLALLHFGEADLSVFQTLHRFLADNPQLISKEVTGLLFPVRFWKEILANSSGADPILVKSLIRQESAFNPKAKSPAKAYGLMQLIYSTARIFGIKKRQQLLEPEANIRVGSEFLGNLIKKFGSVELALAAYNAGPQVVEEWKKRYPTENIDLFVEMIPYAETREYVRLVTRNYRIYQALLSEKSDQKPDLAAIRNH
jgi:hypothetical protein